MADYCSEDAQQARKLMELPDEALLYVMQFLGKKSILALCLVSRDARRLALDAEIWRVRIKRKFRLEVEADHELQGLSWRDVYYMLKRNQIHSQSCSRCHAFPIRDALFKCFHCSNFFLCSTCYEETKAGSSEERHEAGHLFVKVPEPIAIKAPLLYYQFPRNEARSHEISCSECGVSPIVGASYKCRVCPDFSLCQACHANADELKQRSPGVTRHRHHAAHDSTHPFVRNLVHEKPHDARVVTWCDACTKPITCTRYKCLNCFNYDLCESCEKAGKHRGKEKHYFLVLESGASLCCYNLQYVEWADQLELVKLRTRSVEGDR